MPNSVDLLFERLKQFDEVSLVELLDITAEDLLERFRDKVIQRQDILYGEVELIMNEDHEDEDMEIEEWDGFQFEEVNADDFDDISDIPEDL